MAQVPDDQIGSVQQDPLPGRAIPRISDDATPGDFGAGLGEGLEKLAGSIDQGKSRQTQMDIANNEANKALQEKAYQQQMRVGAANAMTDISQIHDQILFGKDENDPDAAYRQSGKTLATMADDYTAKFDQAVGDRLASTTPDMRAMLADHVARVRDEMTTDLHRYAFQQSQKEAVEAFTNSQSQAIQTSYLNFRNPNATQNARDMMLLAGQSLAEKGGADALKAYNESGFLKDMDKLHASDIGAFLAAHDIAGARKYLTKWGDDLSNGDEKLKLVNQIDSEADRLENKSKDGARDRVEDSFARHRLGIDDGPTHGLHPGDLQVLYKDQAPRMQKALDDSAAVGVIGKKYDSMPMADIDKDLQARKPTGTDATKYDVENWVRLNQERDRSLNERTSDSRAFINKTTGAPDLDLSKPIDQQAAVLKSRFNTLDDDSKRLGVSAAPLSKKESAQMANWIDNQDSKTKMAILAQYRDGLGDSRFTALMQQMRPDSPVTTKAALLLPRDPKTAPAWYDAKHDVSGPTTAMHILDGQYLLNPDRLQKKQEGKGGFKGGIEMPEEQKFRDRWDHTEGVQDGAYAGRAKEADSQYEAVKSIYASIVNQSGRTGGAEVDPDAWSEAVKEVQGDLDGHFRNHVPVPRGMDPSSFPTLVKTQLRALENKYGLRDGSLDRGGIEEIGPYGSGVYGVVDSQNRGISQYDGGPVIQFDLNKVGRNGLR